MISKAFARACRKAHLRFLGEFRGFRTAEDTSPRGIERLRKRMGRLPGKAERA
jgi:hypothetical protein